MRQFDDDWLFADTPVRKRWDALVASANGRERPTSRHSTCEHASSCAQCKSCKKEDTG